MKNTVARFLPLHQFPKTRIMVTIGESNYKYHYLKHMLKEGASIFRFNAAGIDRGNFSFEPKKRVTDVLADLDRLSEEVRQPIATFFDLAGPKIRVTEVLSIHDRMCAKLKASLETEFVKECQHPQPGDTVLLYRWGAAKSFQQTVGTQDATLDHAAQTSTAPLAKDHLQNERFLAISYDKTWRLATTITSLESVRAEITLKDGMCSLSVEEHNGDFVKCVVTSVSPEFLFLARQGVNPYGYLFPEIITTKDKRDFKWALGAKFDTISMSFACSPLEAFQLRKMASQHDSSPLPQLFAKFEALFSVDPAEARGYAEKKELTSADRYGDSVGRENWDEYLQLIEYYKEYPIEAICEAFDGAMVARGDLAVEAIKHRVPFDQKKIISACHIRTKPVIVATEVLHSMKAGGAATRAEIGDIATAVTEGADIIMLAGEVAGGTQPIEVVRELSRTIRVAEEQTHDTDLQRDFQSMLKRFEAHRRAGQPITRDSDWSAEIRIGMGSRICIAARAQRSSALFVSANTGETARFVAYFRPAQKIIAITSSLQVAKQLILVRGVYPVVTQRLHGNELGEFLAIAREIHVALKIKPPAGRPHGVFRVPGLLRLVSRIDHSGNQTRADSELLPNSVHEFQLPVVATSLVEREMKYVLLKKHYDRLREFLESEYSEACRKTIQTNVYFRDEQKVLEKAEASVRIRVERLDGVKEDERILLTIKGKQVAAEDGTLLREESEWDVTRFAPDVLEAPEVNIIKFAQLPEFYTRFIWLKYIEEFQTAKVESWEALNLQSFVCMTNKRLTVNVNCGLTLELDSFVTRKQNKDPYYELEIETFPVDEKKRDEFVKLLFGYLGIPEFKDTNYPNKFVRAMMDAGISVAGQAEKEATIKAAQIALAKEPDPRR